MSFLEAHIGLRRAAQWIAALLCILVMPGLVVPTAQAQIFELPQPAAGRHPSFGETVAIEGRRVLVGAPGEATCGPNAGAVYVFERGRDVRAWREAARLVPQDCREGAFFGRSIALSGDRVLVGASDEFFAEERSNVAVVFERAPDGAWRETAQLKVDPEQDGGPFATAVALDGARALVTTQGDPDAPRRKGAAYIFERSADGRWRQTARLRGVGGARRGIFGGAAALRGDRAIVTASTYLARKPGSAYLYEHRGGDSWQQVARFDGLDDFFIPVAIDEQRVLIGESRAGTSGEGGATLYAPGGDGRWHAATALRPHTPYELGGFGTAVSLGGDRALVTGYDEQLGFDFNIDRVVYVFARDARGRWRQRQIIDIGEVGFGAALDHDGDWAVISRVHPGRPGSAYIVRLH